VSSAVRIYESPRAVEWFAGWSGLRLPRAFRELAAPALALCLCAVPLSIAVSHTFLAIALLARLAGLAQRRASFELPRVFRYWLLWACLEALAWLHSPDRRLGAGEIRHMLLLAVLFTTLTALADTSGKVRAWEGIFLTSTLNSIVLILEFLVRLLKYRRVLADGGDPAYYLRTGGLLHHWMVYGAVEIVAFAALLEFCALYPDERRWTRPLLWVHCAAILLSLTRCLWLAALLVFGLHLLRNRSRNWALGAAPGAVLLLGLGPVRERIAETFRTDYSSNAERLQMWRVGWRMIRSSPWFGVGAGRVESLYSTYLPAGDPLPAFHGHLHNNALQVGAQSGVPVLCAAILFTAILMRDLISASRRARSRDLLFLSRSGWMGLTGFLAMGMMDYTYGHSLALMLLAFAAMTPLFAAEK